MKAFRILIAVVSLGALLTQGGCKGSSGNGQTTQEKQFGLLSKTWKISTVSLGGLDQTSSWTGFQLTVSGTASTPPYSYACTARPALSPWPAGGGASGLGQWSFGTDPTTQLIRDPNDTNGNTLPMTYTVTATTLQISFNYTGNGYTRVSNVSGNWVFNFTN